MHQNHHLVEFAPTALTVRGQVAKSLILLRPESGNTETRKAPQKTTSRAKTVHYELFKNQPPLIAFSMGPKFAHGSTRPRSLSCWALPP